MPDEGITNDVKTSKKVSRNMTDSVLGIDLVRGVLDGFSDIGIVSHHELVLHTAAQPSAITETEEHTEPSPSVNLNVVNITRAVELVENSHDITDVTTVIIPKTECDNCHGDSTPRVLLEWNNLEYHVKVKKSNPQDNIFKKMFSKQREKKQILYPMNGYAKPGEVLAIMGPSGSGKTSIMNILAHRVKQSGGDIKVNGEKVEKHFRSLIGYVQQDDILMGNLTVRETLRYAAMLRLPRDMKLKSKMKKVDAVMEELGLSGAADTIVGVSGITRGISGGERKRLSIAVELLTDPSVLFSKFLSNCYYNCTSG